MKNLVREFLTYNGKNVQFLKKKLDFFEKKQTNEGFNVIEVVILCFNAEFNTADQGTL